MITFLSQSSKFKMTLSGYPTPDPGVDGLLYSTSKTMLRLERQDQQKVTFFAVRTSPVSGISILYYSDPSGVLELPLKNFVNANLANAAMSIFVNMWDDDLENILDTVSKDFTVFEGVDEREANIPIKDAGDVFGILPPCIMPPNVIVNPTTLRGSSAPGTILEASIQNTGVGYVWTQYAAGVGTTITPTGGRSNQIAIANTADTLTLANGAKSQSWRLEKADRCTDLVCVRWKSLTGAWRQHYFPVMSYNVGTDKSVSLVSVGDGYEVLKNRNNGVTCRLTGLTPYGYWYYMDLLRSSEVYAVLQSSTLPWVPIAQEAAYVETSAGSVMPNGSGFLSFEFTLRLKHYDTF